MFETEKEMVEGSSIVGRFDFSKTKNLAKVIGSKRVIFTGMGSSVLFPARQAKSRAFELNIKNRIEVYFASDLLSHKDFSDTFVVLCSNSGMTKETILLQRHIKKRKAEHIAITAVQDSILAKKCKDKIIMECGFEKGVAATKSVIEQGLMMDSLIFNLAKNQDKKISFKEIRKYSSHASKSILRNININVPSNMLNTLANASAFYIIGRTTGVADEIALKSHEICRKSAFFYPDTHIVHGIEESIESNPIILFEPTKFRNFLGDFTNFSQRIKGKIFGIDSVKLIDGIKIKSTPYFENYCLLAGGWGMLRKLAKRLNIDIDKPKKALKVGNPYKGK
jgi:glutamine---fructose-6-phosphate transaminase (isomerizing)